MTPIVEELIEHTNATLVQVRELRQLYNAAVQEVNKAEHTKREIHGQLAQALFAQSSAEAALFAHIESGIVPDAPQAPAD